MQILVGRCSLGIYSLFVSLIKGILILAVNLLEMILAVLEIILLLAENVIKIMLIVFSNGR